MPHPTAVILVVGLTERLLVHMPRIAAFARHRRVQPLRPAFPAVTCPVQSSMLTGLSPREHGVIANGWYNRDTCEVRFWQQSNRLVGGEKVWETARRRDSSITTANICWWFNMYSSVDISLTPRPIYTADGRKVPDCYTYPAGLRERVQAELGPFPLFKFWGPGAAIESSRWIAEATRRIVQWHDPTLTLTYLPHLDYALQKFGPDTPEAVAAAGEIDAVAGDLIDFLAERGTRTILCSEYAVEPVDRPIYANRILRAAGLLQVREERGGEVLDAGASRAFAVCDHQCAHVYVRDPADTPLVAEVFAGTPGTESVLDDSGKAAAAIDHPRSGELVLSAARGSWFAYPYWLDDARGRAAPDFARTVDIHRKPGYDPCELFLDPRLPFPELVVAAKLGLRALGFRALLNVIPLDASLVRGSHGRVDPAASDRPVLIADARLPGAASQDALPCESVHDIILDHLFTPERQ